MDSVDKKIIFRRWSIEDSDGISEIYRLIINRDITADFKKRVLDRTHEAGNEAHFVAELDGKIVGFIISYILPFGFGAEDCAYIATMGVHPKHMGQGIGSGMTKEIFIFLKNKGISRVYTSVRWDSSDLLSFFKTLGFDRSKYINLKKDLAPDIGG